MQEWRPGAYPLGTMRLNTLLATCLFCLAASLSSAAETIKLRPLELKTVKIHVADAAGKVTEIPVKYGDLITQVITAPSPQGSSSDDVLKLVTDWLPLKKQLERGGSRVLLTQPEFDLLTAKLNTFKWSPINAEATEVIAEFIQTVRGLKEQDFTVAEAALP